MNIRIKRTTIVTLSILFQFSFALIFTSSPHLLVDNLFNQYTVLANESKWSNNYIHTEISLVDNHISDDASNFISSNVSRRKEFVTYYSLFSSNQNNPIFRTSNYSSAPTILYNPYRYDFNDEYFESFRLRQEFFGIDSRKIDAGFDFNIQISNKEADQILLTNNINDGYDYFRSNKIEVFLDFNGFEYKGLITNLFHIEDEEPISEELYDYNGDYSIIIPTKKLANDVSFKLNHDFTNNSMNIKKEMIKLNSSFIQDSINFFDGSNSNSEVNALYQTLTHESVLNLSILLPSLFGVIFSSFSLFFLIRSMNSQEEYIKQLFPIDLLFSVILYSIIIYTLKRLFVTAFFYMLGNLFSGLLTVFLFVYILIFLHRKERKVIKNEE